MPKVSGLFEIAIGFIRGAYTTGRFLPPNIFSFTNIAGTMTTVPRNTALDYQI